MIIPLWVTLSAVMALKHFIADFPLQIGYMVSGKGKKVNWIVPLVCHCLVHSGLTLLVTLFIHPQYFWLAFVDFGIHFFMDRIKASPNLLGRYKQLAPAEFATATSRQKKEDHYFWWSLGFDQMVHSLTNLLIVFLLLS
jgi:hypothetical protein